MIHHTRFLLGSAALAALCFAAIGSPATAQVPPPSPAPSASAMAPDEPGTSATAAPATMAPATAAPQVPKTNSGQHTGQIKKLKEGKLSYGQLKFALTHPAQEAKKLQSLRTVNFDNIRIVRLSKLNIRGLHAMNVEGIVAQQSFGAPIQVAQTTSTLPTIINGSNSPIQYLRDVLANINVSNALNNVLNNSTVNLNVSLSDVLNNNKIAIGQVVGVYVGGAGLINTIVK